MFLFLSLLTVLMTLTGCQHTYDVKPKKRPDNRTERKERKKEQSKAATARERQKQRIVQAKKDAPYLKSIKKMDFAELKEAKNLSLDAGDEIRTEAILKHMMAIATTPEDLKDVRIELADHNFDKGDLEEAGTQYEDFINFYPGSDLVEYAKYKAILCTYYQTLDADRDQTKTKQAIQQTQQFLAHNDYQTYQADVQVIFKLCRNRQLENEITTFNYYLERNKLSAAEARLEQIKTQFTEHRFNPTLLSLEIQLAQLQGNSTLCEEKKMALATIDADLARRASEGQRIEARTTPEDVKAILVAHGLESDTVKEQTNKSYAKMF